MQGGGERANKPFDVVNRMANRQANIALKPDGTKTGLLNPMEQDQQRCEKGPSSCDQKNSQKKGSRRVPKRERGGGHGIK